MAATNSHRKVSTRVSQPVSGMAMISAIRYAVWIQLIASARYRQRILDRRQRGRDDLNVEDRHEHAEAHQDEAEPGGGVGLGLGHRFVHGVPGIIGVAGRGERAVFGADADCKNRGVEDRKDDAPAAEDLEPAEARRFRRQPRHNWDATEIDRVPPIPEAALAER